METFVTIPNDPSLPTNIDDSYRFSKDESADLTTMVSRTRYFSPINKCFKSYPVLSLRKVPSISSTVPLARTTSRPEMAVPYKGVL